MSISTATVGPIVSSTQQLTRKYSPSTTKLPTTSVAEAYNKKYSIIDASEGRVLTRSQNNGFYTAINIAYSQHYHLVLKPDDLWLTIARGVTAHINNGDNAERLRSKFVTHKGKEEIAIVGDHLDWPGRVDAIAKEVDKRVLNSIAEIMTCNFSTTTPVDTTASQILLMDATKAYFAYRVMLMCGIPSITLLGTLDDWKHIQRKVQYIRKLDIGLDWWLDRIDPILQEFVNTYQGRVNETFWSQIRTEQRYGSGGQRAITGWVANFFPYDSSGDKLTGPRLEENRVPPGSVKVPFILDDNGVERKLALVGGFLGTQQSDDGSVSPHVGWMVVNDDDKHKD